jgi:hypothetical protein
VLDKAGALLLVRNKSFITLSPSGGELRGVGDDRERSLESNLLIFFLRH